MKKLLILAVSLFSVLLFAKEAPTKKVTPKTTTVTKIDVENSKFNWKGTKKLGSNHYGPVKLKSADAKILNGKVINGEFVIDMNTINSEDLASNPDKNSKLIGHLKSKDFFNVKKYPTAKLVITKLNKDKAKGMLTIMGKTHPVMIPYTQNKNSFKGVMTFDRTKFGMIYNSKNFFKKLVDKKVINNDVTIDFTVALK